MSNYLIKVRRSLLHPQGTVEVFLDEHTCTQAKQLLCGAEISGHSLSEPTWGNAILRILIKE